MPDFASLEGKTALVTGASKGIGKAIATELAGRGVTTFVEVGPGNVLSGLLKRIDRNVKTIQVSSLRGLDELEEAVGA